MSNYIGNQSKKIKFWEVKREKDTSLMIQSLPSVSKEDESLQESTKSQEPKSQNYEKVNLQLAKPTNGSQKKPKK